MCISVFYALVFGALLFFTGLASLVHHQRYKKVWTEFEASHALSFMRASLGVLIGLIIVITHNKWEQDWSVVITLLGWLFLLRGIWGLFGPDAYAKMVKDLTSNQGYTVLNWIRVLVGLYLFYMGYHFPA